MDVAGGAGGFDLGAHLAALIARALDDPAHAPPVGWLAAFAREAPGDGPPAVALDRLARAHAALPDGPWRTGPDPRPLLEAVPVFGVAGPEGPMRTERLELVAQDWGAAAHRLCLFDAMAAQLPFMRRRAAAYLEVLAEWYARGPRTEAGLARACHMYAALYNARLYLEAYKLLEVRWMAEQGDARELLRGLMQVAVGLHQVEGGRYAVPQLEEGYARIREHSRAFPSPTIGRFLKRLARAIRLLKAYGPEGFQKYDLALFPHLWMVNPWRLLLTFGRAR